MTQEDVRVKINDLVRRMAPTKPRKVKSSDRLIEDLGYTSLSLVELAFSLEDEFQLEPIDDLDSLEVSFVQDIEQLILDALNFKGD